MSKVNKGARHNVVEERMVKGEVRVIEAQIHLAIYWKSVAVFILGILLALLIVELGLLLVVTGLLMFSYAAAKRSILMFILTNKRVLCRYGLLQIDVVDLHFDKIESVELERMLPGFMFGYSNLVVMGTGNRYIVIPFVANGREIRKAYNELVLGDSDD